MTVEISGGWVTLFAAAAFLPDLAPESGVACEVKAVPCGSFVTTSRETGVSGVTDVVKFDDHTDKVYTETTFLVGDQVEPEVLLLGSPSAKGEMLVTCKVPVGADKWSDYSRLRKDLPALLKASPDVRRQLPHVTKEEIDRAMKFEKLSPADKARVMNDFRPAPK